MLAYGILSSGQSSGKFLPHTPCNKRFPPLTNPVIYSLQIAGFPPVCFCMLFAYNNYADCSMIFLLSTPCRAAFCDLGMFIEWPPRAAPRPTCFVKVSRRADIIAQLFSTGAVPGIENALSWLNTCYNIVQFITAQCIIYQYIALHCNA